MKQLLLLALALSPALALAKTESWKIDTKSSVLRWEATKIGGGHQGTVKLKSGKLEMEKDALKGGELEVDMNSIDITDDLGSMKAKLMNHLRSDDFFSVEKNPTATLKITEVKTLAGGKLEANGDLTIKNIKKPTGPFPLTVTKEGKGVSVHAELQVDRTAYDIKYRSMKFFSDLGDKVIHDKFTVKADLKASK